MFSTRAILLGFLTITAVIYYHALESVFTVPDRDIEVHYQIHPENAAASLPHHKLLMDESVHERIKNTNSSDYTWVGNHWTPPPGVPTFTPRQLKEYYSQRNVLVIGDSTSRRFHGTLYAMMNATNLDDLKAGKIEQDNNKNKYSCYEEMGDRFISHMAGGKWTVCNNNTVEVEDTDGSGKVEKYFKFDHATQFCYEHIEWLWRDFDVDEDLNLKPNILGDHMTGFSKDYDLVILAMGIWEIAQPDECKRKRPDKTSPERLQLMLEAVERNTPDGLQMVFRNSAFDTRYTGADDMIRDSNAVSRQFFHDLDQKSDLELGRYEKNMTLVDWGGVMQSRSYGEDRIEGDHAAHYGLEARLLFIQQLTHELVKSELIASDFQSKEHSSTTSRSTKNPSVLE
jgi:hypothetical protein